ncbi:phosphonate degradation HD-domain oxygenase [Variovorax sp. PAMC 28711]|uniref:phosphonate degradation HD-domain oxygenase n=1 Tax=Variovorax sp. PAMC 28711 TaxID=1795631 RepID=UPI00078D3116|nr:phosphonate degradation HD-domain oxygenase [Variovorax sp. PAMC 28711]AMM23972.1 phosphohydrolase [Variovorax sp. PAMC 28711]
MALTVNEIVQLLQGRGQQQYGGEAISQLDHALQCADLAERAGENAETVVSALLHDLGHLLGDERPAVATSRPASPPHDDLHQYIALPFLRGVFPAAVLSPICLHVDAKRYLCATQPGYAEALSPASVASLALQGGPFDAAQAEAFMRLPFASEAVRLRLYDDQAKVVGLRTPTLDHFTTVMEVACSHNV